MSAAKPRQQAAERSVTEAWHLDKGTYALYAQDPVVKNLAQKAGLRWMGEYYRPDGKGGMRLVAWQFAGEKEKVMQVLKEARRLEKTTARKKKEKAAEQGESAGTIYGTCASCGRPFAVRGKRQKYCQACAQEAGRRQKREWWVSRSAAAAGQA